MKNNATQLGGPLQIMDLDKDSESTQNMKSPTLQCASEHWGIPTHCPKCNAGFETDDIYQHYLHEGKTPEEAKELAGFFGWTEEKPVRFSRAVSIYCWRQDRTVEWECPDCKHRWDRKR